MSRKFQVGDRVYYVHYKVKKDGTFTTKHHTGDWGVIAQVLPNQVCVVVWDTGELNEVHLDGSPAEGGLSDVGVALVDGERRWSKAQVEEQLALALNGEL